MAAAPFRHRHLRSGVRRLGLPVLALALPALLAAPQAHADIDDVLGTELHWDGDVEVSTDGVTATTNPALRVSVGHSSTYYIRLSHDPIYYKHDVDDRDNDGDTDEKVLVPCPEAGTATEREECSWWVRYRLEGDLIDTGKWDLDDDGVADVSVTPSYGRTFLRTDYRTWKSFRVEALSDGEWTVTFTHEVWGDDNECPVHNRGSVTVGRDGGGTRQQRTPTPTLSISDTTVTEGDTARFTVTLANPPSGETTVDYMTVMGTADPGDDYTGQSDTLTFSGGATSQTVSVQTIDDDLHEGTENFTVRLSNSSGPAIADDVGIGTINDNESRPGLSIDDVTVTEGQTAAFTVTLSGKSAHTVTVAYSTGDVTATTADSDYTAQAGTLIFQPEDIEETFTVPTGDDTDVEPDETFSVTLSNATNAGLEDATGVGTITNDDVSGSSLPELSIEDAAEVTEGGDATFTVRLSQSSADTVTVEYSTRGGTATAGTDYTAATSETLTFLPSDTEETITITTLDDEEGENRESFFVTLSNPQHATIRTDAAAGTIADNDGGIDDDSGNNDVVVNSEENWTAREAKKRRIAEANRTILPELGRAMAFDALRCRIDQAFSGISASAEGLGNRPSLSLAGMLAVPGASDDTGRSARGGASDDAGGGGSLSLQQVLGSSSFVLPLMGAGGGASGVATWGCGDLRDLSGDGRGGGPGWDGEVSTVQIGIDARFGSDMLVGVALSRSRGTFDYGGVSGRGQPQGSHELALTGVYPYWGMALSPDLRVWASLGHAWGELEIADRVSGASMSGDATLTSGTVGVISRLLASDTMALRLKGEWAMARLDAEGDGGAMGDASADMQRLRLATEAEYKYLIPYVGLLTPWGELGLRHDGGDGETGASLEVGGGVRYRNIERGWNAELSGRWRAAQGDLPEERGFAARVRYDPQTLGVGPWVSLTRNWGRSASGVHRLWEDGDRDGPAPQRGLAGSLDAEAGYGIPVLRGRSTLAPFGAVSLAGDDGRGYRLGSRLAFGPSARVGLEAERRENPAERTDDTVMVRGDARF